MSLSDAYTVFKKACAKKYSTKVDPTPLSKYDLRKKNSSIEFEIRFGHRMNIGKMEFERVYNTLLSFGFIKEYEEYHLKIMTETKGPEPLKIRTEIDNLSSIKEYCKSNIIPETASHIVKNNINPPIDNIDYNFRVSIQNEYKLNKTDLEIVELYENWTTLEKTFRYMTRIKLIHPDKKGMCVDLSIVKFTKNKDGSILKELDFSTSKLFTNNDTYEIEIEINDLEYLLNDPSTISGKFNKLLVDLKSTVKYILNGIQMSNYPISNTEKNKILSEYGALIGKKEGEQIDATMFIGPSSYTLQKTNLINDETSVVPCVLNNFCVTDKADGDRKLLFISSNGKIYYITMNMFIQYTGSVCTNSQLHGTLIDGEHIIYDKYKKYINIYAAFDIYFIGRKDIRSKPFTSIDDKDLETSKYRYLSLQAVVERLNTNIKYESDINIARYIVKNFYYIKDNGKINIYESCKQLFKNIDFHTYPYETDGIIFTSTNLGVGMETPTDKIKNYKYTWKNSFKWKPPEFNTIDFLVKIQKSGEQDIIEYIDNGQIINPYKILSLSVGYDVNKDGEINSQQLIFEGITSRGAEGNYKAVLFSPSNPIDQLASTCFVQLKNDTTGELKMFTENNEVIENNMVIEFKYEMNPDRRLSWVPLRIRYDKTEDFNKGKSYGNSYRVANSNWYTIHYPITKNMLIGETPITIDEDNDDVYYNTTTDRSKTEDLKKFHNLGVKSILIDVVCTKGTVLIDYAVGRGGDLNKWNKNKIKFVLGIDISKDNIHNPKGGVCSRYIGIKKKFGSVIDGLFIHGDTSKLLETGEFANDEDKGEEDNSKFVFDQVMGKGTKKTSHGQYIAKMFGIASDLFDVGSIQFAVHYMFKDKLTLHSFLKNCADTIKVGGYLIGTCYDGERVFDMLKDCDIDEKKEIYLNEKCIWYLKKKYNIQQKFKFDDNSEDVLGYTIGVYQESINKEFDEYLVNFKYFIKMMGIYGFMPSSPVPDVLEPIDSFETLYNKSKFKMSNEEEKISFLNNYFIFKKVRQVSTTYIYNEYTTNEEEFDFNIGNLTKLNKKIVLTQ